MFVLGRYFAALVAAVKSAKAGLRSEDIRQKLGLDVREVPRVLQVGAIVKKPRFHLA